MNALSSEMQKGNLLNFNVEINNKNFNRIVQGQVSMKGIKSRLSVQTRNSIKSIKINN